MSEKFKLIKNIENFIDTECAYKKNSPFIATFQKENDNSNLLPKIIDNSNFIQCIMNIPKEKEALITGEEKEFKVNVTDSSFEFVLYKSKTFRLRFLCDTHGVRSYISDESDMPFGCVDAFVKILRYGHDLRRRKTEFIRRVLLKRTRRERRQRVRFDRRFFDFGNYVFTFF